MKPKRVYKHVSKDRCPQKVADSDVAVHNESEQNKSKLMRRLSNASASATAAATEVILGLDVAKDSVEAELQLWDGSKVHFAFTNKRSGFNKLERFLERRSVLSVHAGLEATGIYSAPLAYWLHDHAHRVSLLNPRRSQRLRSERRLAQ